MLPYKGDKTMSAVMEPALISLEVLYIKSVSFLSGKVGGVNELCHGKLPHIKLLFI